jgi:hypothetical protein
MCPHRSQTANLTDDYDDFMVVVGVNHKKINTATYTAIGLFSLNRMMGVGSISDEDYDGSAEFYLGDDVEIAPYLFAYIFARDCTNRGPYCYEVPTSINPTNDGVMFMERVYLHPQTLLGMYTPEVVNPIMMHYAPSLSSYYPGLL